jgi:flavin reductase (DIM6/NTAB) family NADH-FMN oxidoreductase RutF
MLASWVMQAAFEPPALTVAVNRERYLAGWLKDGADVAVNILAEDEKDMISHFGRGIKPGEPAFDGVDLLSGEAKAPILADALAYLSGKVQSYLDAGDHIVFLIRVDAGRMLQEGAPMLHVRKNGLRY